MCNIHCLGCCRGVSGDKAILFWSAPLVVGLRAKDRSLNQIYLVYRLIKLVGYPIFRWLCLCLALNATI